MVWLWYETQTIQVPKYSSETRTGYQQVPRMTEETVMQTSYQSQTIQEPVQVMVPQTQTVNTIQTINKVTEYQRQPVNQYSVPGPSYQVPGPTYTQPAVQAMPMQSMPMTTTMQAPISTMPSMMMCGIPGGIMGTTTGFPN